ncbi:MAG: OmpA family protein [Nitrospiraceae bacterium]
MNKGAEHIVYAANPTADSAAHGGQADRGISEVMIVGGSVLVLAVGIGIAWMVASQPEQTTRATSVSFPSSHIVMPDVSTSADRTGEIVGQPVQQPSVSTAALPTQFKESHHADISFDFGKTRLTDEAKVYLDEHAAFMTRNQDYGLLIQGYTDGRGSSFYNRALGLKRAESVKAYLIGLGVSEHRIKTASLGEDGVLCLDDSSDCLMLNRRAHLEFIKVGSTHLMPPVESVPADSTTVPSEPVTAEPIVEPVQDSTDTSILLQPVESQETENQLGPDDPGVTP